MTPSNLAIVFAPNIFKSPGSPSGAGEANMMDLGQSIKTAEVLTTMIENVDQVFQLVRNSKRLEVGVFTKGLKPYSRVSIMRQALHPLRGGQQSALNCPWSLDETCNLIVTWVQDQALQLDIDLMSTQPLQPDIDLMHIQVGPRQISAGQVTR